MLQMAKTRASSDMTSVEDTCPIKRINTDIKRDEIPRSKFGLKLF